VRKILAFDIFINKTEKIDILIGNANEYGLAATSDLRGFWCKARGRQDELNPLLEVRNPGQPQQSDHG
jgi:hypothetical protein